MATKCHRVVRRKKTNADKKKEHVKRAREKALDSKRLQWRDLAHIHVSHTHLLTNSDDAVTQMLGSVFVKEAMTEEQLVTFTTRHTELQQAIAMHRQSLTDIGEKHLTQSGAAITLMESLQAIQIGEEYEKWYNVVMDDVVTRSQSILMDIEDIIVQTYPSVAAAREALATQSEEPKESVNDNAE
jgi:hypothetical protein